MKLHKLYVYEIIRRYRQNTNNINGKIIDDGIFIPTPLMKNINYYYHKFKMLLTKLGKYIPFEH